MSHINILIDHSEYVGQFQKAGFKVYGTGDGNTRIEPLKAVKFGGFTVTPFEVPHDTDLTCYGYLIQHKEIGKLLFLTDLMYCPYSFKKQQIEHLVVECNYIDDYVNKEAVNFKHTLQGHCSLSTCLGIVEDNKSDKLRNVILAHLSTKNCDGNIAMNEVKKLVYAPIFVAKKGLEVELSLPF